MAIPQATLVPLQTRGATLEPHASFVAYWHFFDGTDLEVVEAAAATVVVVVRFRACPLRSFVLQAGLFSR